MSRLAQLKNAAPWIDVGDLEVVEPGGAQRVRRAPASEGERRRGEGGRGIR